MLSSAICQIGVWIFIIFNFVVDGSPWASPALEQLDEINDAKIYEAVITSMNEWERKQNLKKAAKRVKREENNPSVCYDDLGCFEASGPFGYLDMLPSTPQEIGTKFLLYPGHSRRRSGSSQAEVPFHNLTEAFEWAKQGFNSSLSTKVLIHGFGSGCNHIWVYEMRSALIAVEEINVICVDWENGAILPNYVKATANTRLVGKQLAMLLEGLVKHNGLQLKKTHLVGFSLGAHVAGFAGAEIGNLSRITGLDPAGPLFESQDPRARLDQSDAEFVDVIHSNGENLILGGLGSYQPMGHVDFYPNGGRMQKGCTNLFVGAVSDIIWSSAVEGRSLCNHRRAYKFFTDSVSPRCHFPAFPCGSYEDFLAGKCFPCTDERKCGNMGYYADRSKGRGQLYLITRDEEPFCAHQYHVKIESSPSPVPIINYGKIQITLIGDSTLNETFMMTRKEDEEMKLGQSISRILVPHPILAEPTKIQILYTAYSGWLSSGLTQWTMDKVTLSDSFGKVSSTCRKSLVLDSGVPVTLPMYPGECNVPSDNSVVKEAEDRIHDSKNKTHTKEYAPTPVVKMGTNEKEYTRVPPLSLKDAIEILNIPWRENTLTDDSAETSRAFNNRVVKSTSKNGINAKDDKTEDVDNREIVEPILKPQTPSKNARSHNPDKGKPEITEPILGPTSGKNRILPPLPSPLKNDFLFPDKVNQEFTFDFYGNGAQDKSDSKNENLVRTREGDSKSITSFESANNPFEQIVSTVQFLPQRLARMFDQAEKYARENILPLVSTYTPKFITDIIGPKPKPVYVPLSYSEESKNATNNDRIESESSNIVTRSNKNEDKLNDTGENEINKPDAIKKHNVHTHIQKIRKKGEKIEFVFANKISIEDVLNQTLINHTAKEMPTTTRRTTTTEKIKTTIKAVVSARAKRRNAEESFFEGLQNLLSFETTRRSTKKPTPKAIYIDLPVFDTRNVSKYIPLG